MPQIESTRERRGLEGHLACPLPLLQPEEEYPASVSEEHTWGPFTDKRDRVTACVLDGRILSKLSKETDSAVSFEPHRVFMNGIASSFSFHVGSREVRKHYL